jgi:rubredoxin
MFKKDYTGMEKMNSELEMVKKLYERRKRGDLLVPPKQTFFNWKCPKCSHKLNKKSFKAPLYAEAGQDEFANNVIQDYGFPPGLYNIAMDHFICSCGYEYISAKLDQVEF